MTWLVGAGPFIAVLLAAVLACRALVVAGLQHSGRLSRPLAFATVPLAILLIVSIAAR